MYKIHKNKLSHCYGMNLKFWNNNKKNIEIVCDL